MRNVLFMGNIADCEDADGRTAAIQEIRTIQSTKNKSKADKVGSNENVPHVSVVRESNFARMVIQNPTHLGLMAATTCLNEALH